MLRFGWTVLLTILAFILSTLFVGEVLHERSFQGFLGSIALTILGLCICRLILRRSTQSV
jgi:hypothetical protein